MSPMMFLRDIAEIGVPDLDRINSKRLQLQYTTAKNFVMSYEVDSAQNT